MVSDPQQNKVSYAKKHSSGYRNMSYELWNKGEENIIEPKSNNDVSSKDECYHHF